MAELAPKKENKVMIEEVRPPHMLNENEILARYNTSEHGLSKHDAADLLSRLGTNELREAQQRSAIAIFFAQFNDFLIWILIGAAALSAYMGEVHDSIAIVIILAVNAFIGFIQELRAQKAMSALCKMSPPKAHIVRDGHLHFFDEELSSSSCQSQKVIHLFLDETHLKSSYKNLLWQIRS